MALDPPTSGMLNAMPMTSWPRPWMVRPVGSASSVSRLSTWVWTVLWTSTMGDAPETVTVSSSAPTLMSALIVAVNAVGSSRPSRLNELKPGSVKTTV